jgi:hypothetical protein
LRRAEKMINCDFEIIFEKRVKTENEVFEFKNDRTEGTQGDRPNSSSDRGPRIRIFRKRRRF